MMSQVALIMQLPTETRKLASDCTGVGLSLAIVLSELLFCFTEGVSCSSVPEGECQCMLSLYLGFEALGSGNRVMQRDMCTARQVRICFFMWHGP